MPSAMPPWRVLLHGPASPAQNMAVDEALLRHIQGPVLRVYEWNVPAISLGYFQSAELAAEGRPFIRRYTGGGLVDHAHDVTYTVVLPRAHSWMELSAPASYEMIHRGVQHALESCGVVSEINATAAMVESDACFQKPVRFDLVASGQKLSGAAQRRTREGMLHQGSILLPDPAKNPELRAKLAQAFAERLKFNFTASELTDEESSRANELERNRYSTEAWNRLK